ncbi:hypothetical protein [Aeromicrobium fastidiosum]|uniref:hypothetical protein n=1 Tax=Aeromicrobium fastidiosum TaxID=52699 RepID=UPI00165EDDA0|nr:hypothetical protein [Aeromicrobium fastidiosum]MBP2390103.1 hypothetical protein [Aeromicrobium fastidiosum]
MSWRTGKGGVQEWVGEPIPEPDAIDLHLNYGMSSVALSEKERKRLAQLQEADA